MSIRRPGDTIANHPALLAAQAIRTIRLLADQDLGKRMAMREQIQTDLVETWGE